MRTAASSTSYGLPPERPFWMFLGGSATVLALAVLGYGLMFRPEPPPAIVEVDLSDIAAVPGEPPPKGDAAAPVEPTPAPTPEATPEPTPEPTPPPPVEKPEFVKPEPVPTPPPKPKAVAARPPEPPRASRPPTPPRPVAAAPAPAAVRGTSSGVVGGRGGSKGDFTATPHPQYDLTATQRHYQGSGSVLITYSNGAIVSVEMSQSTGVSYLDSKTVSWVKSMYRVKPGVSGRASFNIAWTLPR